MAAGRTVYSPLVPRYTCPGVRSTAAVAAVGGFPPPARNSAPNASASARAVFVATPVADTETVETCRSCLVLSGVSRLSDPTVIGSAVGVGADACFLPAGC